jgi:transcriptional regulator with XRE-family HTH domain
VKNVDNYQRIKDLREDADKTQQDIADIFGMYLTTYRRYENGEREPPFNFILRLAKFYNVSADYIGGLTNDKRKFW